MMRFDERKELSNLEKIFEWFRLNSEIGKLNKKIAKKEKESKGDLLKYKWSGTPTLKLNRDFKRKERDLIKFNK